MSVAKTLRAERARIVTEARALIEKPEASAEDMAKFDAMMEQADALQARIDRAEKAAALEADLAASREVQAAGRGVSVAQVEDEAVREKRLLRAYLAGTVQALGDEDRRIVASRIQAAAGTTSNGAGYTIAPGFQRELIEVMKTFGGVRPEARGINTDTGVDLPWPAYDDTAQMGAIINENTLVPDDTDLTFTSATLKGFTYRSGILKVSLQLLQDSAFDFDALVRDAMAKRLGRIQNKHFTTGTGTNEPQGVLTASTAGKTGAAGSATKVTVDDLLDLEHSIDPAYRPGAVFMVHDSTVKALRKIVDGQGRSLLVEDFVSPATILGRRVVVNQDMPVMAANAKSILFGNFQNYIVRDILGMQVQVLRERYADYLQVGYIAFLRTDGRVATPAAVFKHYANSAT